MLALRPVFEPNVGLPTPPAGPLLLVSFHCPPQGHMELNPGFSCGSLEIKARGRRKTGAGYQGVRERSTAGSSVLRAADFPTYGTMPVRPPSAAAMWTLVVSVVASPGPGPLSCCACTGLVGSQGTIVLWSWKVDTIIMPEQQGRAGAGGHPPRGPRRAGSRIQASSSAEVPERV